MPARTLMVQGTTSDAGKSFLVTALCRWLQRQGVSVAPFKPQNMALNSAVTDEGGEIGRSQAVQAQACRLPAHVDMNPVLLKPNTDIGAQVIVHGKAIGNMDAVNYHEYKKFAKKAVFESYTRLTQKYEAIIVEGAGSPAEVNLRDNDIANMGFAEQADCPVVLIADIDKGGVFAHIIGTLSLLSETEQNRIAGFVINRFRGDISLLQPGLDWLEKETGKPVLGVIPYLNGLHLEAEDAIQSNQITGENDKIKIVIPVLPRISNHTDFDPLRLHPQVDLVFVGPDQMIPSADLVILPGTKSVRDDLLYIKDSLWQAYLEKHLRYGGKVLGICGGFQMLGKHIHDPEGIEGRAGASEALGWLDMETTLKPHKQLHNVTGTFCLGDAKVKGYEIHAGISTGPALQNPAMQLGGKTDGAVSPDGQIIGTYLHGLFETAELCNAILKWAGIINTEHLDYDALREKNLERMADVVEEHLATESLRQLLQKDKTSEENSHRQKLP